MPCIRVRSTISEMGYAGAIAWVLLVMVGMVTALIFRLPIDGSTTSRGQVIWQAEMKTQVVSKTVYHLFVASLGLLMKVIPCFG